MRGAWHDERVLAIVLPVLPVLALLPSADPSAPAISGDLDLTGLVDVGATIPGAHVEMKYSTTDNFMKRDV